MKRSCEPDSEVSFKKIPKNIPLALMLKWDLLRIGKLEFQPTNHEPALIISKNFLYMSAPNCNKERGSVCHTITTKEIVKIQLYVGEPTIIIINSSSLFLKAVQRMQEKSYPYDPTCEDDERNKVIILLRNAPKGTLYFIREVFTVQGKLEEISKDTANAILSNTKSVKHQQKDPVKPTPTVSLPAVQPAACFSMRESDSVQMPPTTLPQNVVTQLPTNSATNGKKQRASVKSTTPNVPPSVVQPAACFSMRVSDPVPMPPPTLRQNVVTQSSPPQLPANSATNVKYQRAVKPTTPTVPVPAVQPGACFPARVSDPVRMPLPYLPQYVAIQSSLPQLPANSTTNVVLRSSPSQLHANSTTNVLSQYSRSQCDASTSNGVSQSSPYNIKMLRYPPPPCRKGIEINTSDKDRLKPGKWLNDNLISFYLEYIFHEKIGQEDQARTHIFSTFFFTNLFESLMVKKFDNWYDRVKNHTRRLDLFSYEIIIVPINLGGHWSVAFICYPGYIQDVTNNTKTDHGSTSDTPGSSNTKGMQNKGKRTPCCELSRKRKDDQENSADIQNKDDDSNKKETASAGKKEPYILLFDSYENLYQEEILKSLKMYLQKEWETKKATEKIVNFMMIERSLTDCLQQPNTFDCGIYVILNVEHFFKYLDCIDYSLMPDLTYWYSYAEVSEKRHQIEQLIDSLAAR